MNTMASFITGRSLPPRCSRTGQVRPFPIKTVPRTVFMGNVRRTWHRGAWFVNPSWGDLKFQLDPLDNSVKSIDRMGSIFERTGSVTGSASSEPAYVFDRQYVIKRTSNPIGWRWSDRRGNWITYSAEGRITAYGDRNNITVSFVYSGGAANASGNVSGNLTEVRDHNGNVALSFTYTGESLSEIADRTGRRVRYGYTAAGSRNLLTSVTDATGYIWAYEYNGDGQVTKITDPENRAWTITYASSVPAPGGSSNLGIQLKSNGAASSSSSGVFQTGSRSSSGGLVVSSNVNPALDTKGEAAAAIYAQIDAIFGAAGGGGAVNPLANPVGYGVGGARSQQKNLTAPSTNPVTVGAQTRGNVIARVGTVTDPQGRVTTYQLDYDRGALQYVTTVRYPATPEIAASGNLPVVPASPGRVVNSLYDREGRMLQQATGAGAQRVTSTLNRLSPFDEETTDERGLMTKTIYDSARNPLRITYSDGTSASAEYEANFSLPLRRTDERGIQMLYQYDGRGNLVKMVEAAGTNDARLSEYTYDSFGQRLTMTRRANMPVNADTVAQLATASAPADPANDATTIYTYDQYGNVTSLTDPEGNVTQHTSFDVMGNLKARTDARNHVTEMSYDALGRLLTMTEAKGTPEERGVSYTYDKTGLRKTMTDARGHTSTYQYDGNRRMVSMTQPALTQPNINPANATTQPAASTRTDYDAEGRKLRDIDADGIAMNYRFDLDGRPTGSIDAAGNSTQFLYGSTAATGTPTPGVQAGLEGLLAAVIYPTYREDYRYDVRNRQTQVIQSLSTTPDNTTTRYTSTTEYDAVGNPVKRTDPKGNATLTEYDALNRAIKITDPLGGVTRFVYDRRDNLIRVIDPKNSITQYAYDRSNRKLAEVRPLGDKTTYAYDRNSNLTETISANGNKKSFTYDALNRRITESHYLGTGSIPGTTQIAIAQFNQARVSNLANLITGNATQGAPIATGSRAISYVYDKNGNLTSWNDRQASSTAASNPNDPNHAATSSNADVLSGTFIYDEVNRQISIGTTYSVPNQTNPNSPPTSSFTKTSLQSYSAAGRLKTRTDADGKSHTLDYDGAGRVSKLALPATANTANAPSAGDILFPQYQWNQIKEIQFPSGVRQTYQYDALQRPTEIKVAPPATGSNNPNPAPANQNPLMNFTYQYDEVSNPIQITRAFAGCNAFAPQPVPPAPACDASAANSTYAIQTNYGYDKLYRLTNVIPNQITNATPTETYAYDLVHNRLAEQKSNHPSGLINASTVGRAFTYNANHQLAGIAQLVQAINPANQTDPNSLPSNVFGSVLENRTYSSDGHTKDVNPSGANNEQSGATVDQARTYLYDASERLIEVKTAGNQTVATYRYDPFGRRVRKTVSIPNTTITPQNPIAQSAGTTFFGFASEGMIAEFGETGSVKVAYAYTPALASGSHATWQTNPLYKREPSPSGGGQGGGSSGTDNLHAFHTDHLGTTQTLSAIASSSAATIGKVTWRANYESFGEAFVDQTLLNQTNLANGTSTENNHRFPGQLYDSGTKLSQNLYREYENGIASYVQSDPIGLRGGINTKGYAKASPVVFSDPKGLAVFRGPPGNYSDIPPPAPLMCEQAIWAGGFIIGWKPCDEPPPPDDGCGNGSGGGGGSGGRGGGGRGGPGPRWHADGGRGGGGGDEDPPPPPPFWPCFRDVIFTTAVEILMIEALEHKAIGTRFEYGMHKWGRRFHVAGAGMFGYKTGTCINNSFIR
jgi:RHS repeat-associated protein